MSLVVSESNRLKTREKSSWCRMKKCRENHRRDTNEIFCGIMMVSH